MTPHNTPLTPLGDPIRRRTTLVAVCLCVATLLALAGCSVGGESVDAGVASADASATAAPATDAETGTDCPEWADEIVSAPVAADDADVVGLGDHYRDRSVVLAEIADGLPTSDAEIIRTYAAAVDEFGDDPLAPGASRRVGEAAADAALVASRSC